jgi:E3 ubiquitin-protein ligase HUWE1
MMTDEELASLLGGSELTDESVADWREHSIESGDQDANGVISAHSHTVMGWFWRLLKDDMTPLDRGRVLLFATGCSRRPVGGFMALEPRFRLTVGGAADKLPTSATCFNTVHLPAVTSYEALCAAMRVALDFGGVGFELA